jgi:hypothetical protein
MLADARELSLRVCFKTICMKLVDNFKHCVSCAVNSDISQLEHDSFRDAQCPVPRGTDSLRRWTHSM